MVARVRKERTNLVPLCCKVTSEITAYETRRAENDNSLRHVM